MESVFANRSASISELKKNPSSLIDKADGEPIVILNHNKPTAYLIPSDTYEMIIEKIEDYQWGKVIKEREEEKKSAIEVDLDEL
ncbi:MAG: antitoxin [Candidatus Delongbacteria bacterium]|nr:MAG: antitoxin [Candidatus Delongbacteria bacterium]